MIKITPTPALCWLFLLLPFTSAAQDSLPAEDIESPYSLGAATDIYSRYVWRGLASSDGAVLQPSIWCGIAPITASIWGNIVLGNESNQGQFNELDYSLLLNHSIGILDISASINYFQYHHQSDIPSTGEVELTLSHSFSSFDTYITNSVDFLEYSGAYFGSLGIGTPLLTGSIEIYHDLSLGWSSSKFNETYIGVAENSLLVLTYSASSGFEWGKMDIEPHLALSYIPATRLRETVTSPFLAVIGISISQELLPCN